MLRTLIAAHPAIAGVLLFYLFSNMVQALPTPGDHSSAGYRWVFAFSHGLAGNIRYALQKAMPNVPIAPVCLLAIGLGVLASCGGGGRLAWAQTTHAAYRHDGGAILNDLKATPGATDPALTKAKLCADSFRTADFRAVTWAQKARICREYGIEKDCPGAGYEIDHLISIELGGSNEDSNLWPQPVDVPGTVGFRAKDVVENRAHRAVCDGRLSLAEAQEGIRKDWYAFGISQGFLDAARK